MENKKVPAFQSAHRNTFLGDKGLIVGFDLDGVLYDFGASVVRYLKSKGLSYSFTGEEPCCWDFYKHWDMPLEYFIDVCNEGADAGYIFSGPARPNARHIVQSVRDAGNYIVIITDRKFGTTPKVSEEATRQWLWSHQIPYDELIFSSDKTIRPTHIFIEDKLENYDALAETYTKPVLVSRPWNATEDERVRIDTPEHYPAIVELYKAYLQTGLNCLA